MRGHLLVALVGFAACKPLLGIDEAVVVPGDSATGADSSSDGPPIDAAPGAWWNDDYAYRHEITFDTSGLAVPLPAIPLFMRVPAMALGDPSGSDLRFVDVNGNELPLEIDSIDPATSLPSVWVLVDLTANTRFYLYGGNSLAQSVSNGAAVFGAQQESVHHFTTLVDSTAKNHTLQTSSPGTTPLEVSGLIGRARNFDGSDFYDLASSTSNTYDFRTEMSASAWVLIPSFQVDYQAIVVKGDTTWRLQRSNATRHVQFTTTVANGNDILVGNADIDDGAWHQIAISFAGGTKSLYVDGALDAQVTGVGATNTNVQQVRIGGNSQSAGRNWLGSLDEVRISGKARTAAQVKAEYETVHSPARLTVGPREQRF